ncbi:L,D-transpeptidase family protein [Neobacillus niacini]|uniref:L,D-transpeptidase family protein n=1 Tax=Neobacillus niacini TaxID=86668 RepID=UPI003983D290
MENAIQESRVDISKGNSFKKFKNWKFITAGVIIVIALICGALSFYQATHFNSKVKINGIEVGGLTADKALEKLETTVLSNVVYIGDQQIIDGKDTSLGFTKSDLPEVKKLLKNQWTFIPTADSKEFSLTPSEPDPYRTGSLKEELEQKLISMNQNLKAPTDSQVKLEQGQIVVTKGVIGEQYDVEGLLEDFQSQKFTSEIHLNPVLLQPLTEESTEIVDQKKKLEALLQHTVEYKVQDKVHSLKGSDLIKNASVTKDLTVTIDPGILKEKIAEINNTQSTLGKNFSFKTHSGAVVSVKGQGYGWALDVDKEAALVQAAFEKGEKAIAASNIRGNGWSGEGYGYETLANNGIGGTYAEISIAEQRIWLYRDGQLVLTTNVVTGKHSTGEDTSPGVWYVLFKRTPYTLKGSAVGKPDYSVEVDYWAPFTNSGQGFHDAGWRTNWNSNAYLTQGSGGCVNVSPSMMKAVYDNLSVYQPVVVY